MAYATALGADPFSDHMETAWRNEGIDITLVSRIENRLPGLYTIQVDAAGERHFSYWRDTSAVRAYFEATHTPLEDAADTLAALYLSGISLAILPDKGRERLFSTMARVRANGGWVVFDNNFRPRLWSSPAAARAAHDQAYSLSDIVLITLDDEMALRGETDSERALVAAFALQAPEVVVKRGTQPTLVRIAGTPPVSIAVEPVAHVVDTTAAGDSFAGAYLAMRLSGSDPSTAARAANRLAAVVIQHPGAIIPSEFMPASTTLLATEAVPYAKTPT